MRKIILVLIFSFFVSCKFYKENVMFEIKNNSNSVLDSLIIQPNYSNFISLKSGETKKYIVNMNKVSKGDGAYVLQYKINDERKSYAFGYFTNGIPFDDYFIVTIEKEKVKFTSIDK
ncbi:hypothetical protein LPB136_07405 [Tenacibaculum todarodis]|uniref:Lipoprotein n=1 Tax=Tenacibaculum todarodis TaxID=1850252 RepID=A0A1L3JJ66_9FLAO|nr:hypothetical protein [Tenacibaculum todarodis]APG65181.1 hypothetical protein LPB136_07405 [Tenacibaculum todarodis]